MKRELNQLLEALHQPHLIEGIDTLSNAQLESFYFQLMKYPPELLASQKKELAKKFSKNPPPPSCTQDLPWLKTYPKGSSEDIQRGESLLSQGRVGCLILAGGQGSRLGLSIPKGTIPVTAIRKKSLFQLFCEKTKAASTRYGISLPLCIMTSPLNHEQTVTFLENHKFFSLSSDQITVFQQEMLPFLSSDGNWLLENPGNLAEGPNGNGEALFRFSSVGPFEKWKKMGIDYLQVILVDNALADPFDAESVGLINRLRAQAVLKAVERLSPEEPMGLLINRNNHLKVIEYSERPPHLINIPFSSTGLFCFSMEWISHLQARPPCLPLHLAHKSAPIYQKGHQEQQFVWKSEKFLFDLLDVCKQPAVFLCPRDETYAPLKNANGNGSLISVQKALVHYDLKVLESLTGIASHYSNLELDPTFYYPTEALRKHWKGRSLSDVEYIFPNQL